MRFWDSSAVFPLLIEEAPSPSVRIILNEQPEMVWWWATSLELVSAAARLRRENRITVAEETRVLATIAELRDECLEIQPSERVHALASRLLRTHALRAADALQLAAALAWSGTPRGDVFVTLDHRLAVAAQLEGFLVVPTA